MSTKRQTLEFQGRPKSVECPPLPLGSASSHGRQSAVCQPASQPVAIREAVSDVRHSAISSQKPRVECQESGVLVLSSTALCLGSRMAGLTVKQSKAVLRTQMGRVLGALTLAEVERQSAVVVDKVLKHPRYLSARSVSVYLSFEREVATDALVRDALTRGKHCFVPRFVKGRPDMDMVRLASVEDFEALPVNAWNIRQPGEHELRESVFEHGQLDLVLAPGLAFTVQGARLGRGKGYYDAFLTRCRQHMTTPPFVIALAFTEQLLPELPTAEHDVILDAVLVAD